MWDGDDTLFGEEETDDLGNQSTNSSSSYHSGGGIGGNNQISRKNYCQGPQTERVGSPCSVMMVAEKPSIALSITEALCGKNFQKKSGPAKGIPIYTFKGIFKKYQANFKVTSVAGHLYQRDFP